VTPLFAHVERKARQRGDALIWSNQSVVLTQRIGGRAATHAPFPDWVVFDVSRRSSTSPLRPQLPTYRCVALSDVQGHYQTNALQQNLPYTRLVGGRFRGPGSIDHLVVSNLQIPSGTHPNTFTRTNRRSNCADFPFGDSSSSLRVWLCCP